MQRPICINIRIYYIYQERTFIEPHEGNESVSTEGIQGGIQEWTILNPGNDEAGHSTTDGALGTVSTFCQGS